MTEIAGRTVLVTGAASGLGRLIALRCARLGGRLALWDLDGPGVDRVADEIAAHTGVRCHADRVDVSAGAQVYPAADAVRAHVGDVDVLVNNAGIMHGGTLTDLPDEAVEATFRVNVLSLFWVTKAFLPAMVARNRGHIVTMGSASGRIGVARLSAYAASKHAAVGFDESLRAELRQLAPGVRTTQVNPYYVATGLAEGARSRYPRLLPILEPDAVAARVVDAVRRDRLVVEMPWLVKATPWLRFLPPRVFDRIADTLGINVSMNDFVGRHGSTDATRVA